MHPLLADCLERSRRRPGVPCQDSPHCPLAEPLELLLVRLPCCCFSRHAWPFPCYSSSLTFRTVQLHVWPLCYSCHFNLIITGPIFSPRGSHGSTPGSHFLLCPSVVFSLSGCWGSAALRKERSQLLLVLPAFLSVSLGAFGTWTEVGGGFVVLTNSSCSARAHGCHCCRSGGMEQDWWVLLSLPAPRVTSLCLSPCCVWSWLGETGILCGGGVLCRFSGLP